MFRWIWIVAESNVTELGCTEIATPVEKWFVDENFVFDVDRYGSALNAWRRVLADGAESDLAVTVFSPDEKFVLDYPNDLPRNDPRLIQVVEELGEQANDRFASLAIVEIPDDVQWEIDEYDGNEHIAEKHRTWG